MPINSIAVSTPKINIRPGVTLTRFTLQTFSAAARDVVTC